MKKIVSILLITVMMIALCSPVGANTYVQSTEFAMFDLYKGLRKLDSVESINPEEMFVWGFFLSNYLEPFADGDNKGYTIFLGSKKNYLYYGQPDYTESLEKLFKKVLQFQFSKKKQILLGGSDQIATFGNLITSENIELTVDVSGSKLTVFNGANKASNLGLLLALAKGKEVLEKETYENIMEKTLCMDAFGNILLDDDRVVIPAVLNPYILSSTGDRFLFVNDYMLANYAHDVATDDSLVSIRYAIPLTVTYEQGKDKFKDPYNKYLYLGNSLDDPILIASGLKKVEDVAELNMANNAKFNFKVFTRDYGYPAFTTLYSDVVSKQGFVVTLCEDYNNIKSEVFKNVDSIDSTDKVEDLFVDIRKMLKDIENSNDSQVSLKLFLDKEIIKVSEFEKSYVFGLFKSETELGKAINQKINYINTNGLSADLDNFMAKMAMPERSDSISLLGQSFDVTSYGVGMLKSYTNRDAALYLDSIIEYLGMFSFLGSLGSSAKSNYTAKMAKMIANEYIYNVYVLNESELFQIFTTRNGSINTLGDNFVTSMYYSYLKLYFGNMEGYEGWAGFNTALVSEFLRMADYSSLLSQLITENYIMNNEEKTKEDIINNIRGLLDPDDATYRVNYVNSTANEWLVNTHYKLTNAYSEDATASNTKEEGYSGLSNFITTPLLKETPFINNIISNFTIWYIMIFAIFFIFGIILFAVGAKTLKEILVYFAVVAVFLILPPYLIDNTVNLSNDFSEVVFSKKLGNWAITQHQQYLLDLNKSGSSLANSIQMIKGAKSKEGVLLKWNSPKKINPYNDLYSMKDSKGNDIGLNIFKWVSQGFLQQEFYIDDTSQYLYRSMYDVSKSSKDAYDNYVFTNDGVRTVNKTDGTALFNYVDVVQDRQIMISEGKYGYFPIFSNTKHYYGFYLNKGGNSPVQDTFNPVGYPLDLETTVLDTKNYNLNNSRNINEMFLVGTEGVYFYFYNVIRDYLSNTPSTTLEGSQEIGTGFSSLLLSDDVFKVTNPNSPAYGKIKDFLDMEYLFKNVIPYYKAFNTIAYDKIKSDKNMSDEEMLRYWSYYSIWVSALERTEYGKNDDISIIGKSIRIADSFDYRQYEKYRPMLFSKAQQLELGYNSVSLSIVESKIQSVLEKTYIDWRYLINNVGFSDESLIVTAALQATYNFNKEFSRSFVFKENASLYPQGYDLRGFSYDTIMKMLLMTSTGEPLFGDRDIYERAISKSSWISGGLLVVSDFLAVVIVANIRYVYVIIVFIMTYILLLLYSVRALSGSTEGIVSVAVKSLVIPIAIYVVASLGHSLIISALIGNSYNNLVGTQNAIVLRSPTSLFAWFIFLNVIYTIVLVVVILYLLKDFKGAFKALVGSVAGLATATAGYIGGKLASAGKTVGKVASYGIAGVTGELKRRMGMDWAVTNTELMRMDRRSRKMQQRIKDELKEDYGYDADADKNKSGKQGETQYSDNISESVEQMKSAHTKQLPTDKNNSVSDTDNKNIQELKKRLEEIEKTRKYVREEVRLRKGSGE